MPQTQPDDARGAAPHWRVLRGRPDEEQLAALAVVLAALSAARLEARTPDHVLPPRAAWRQEPDDPGAGSWRRRPAG